MRAWTRSIVWLSVACAGQHGDHFAVADRLRGHVAEGSRPGLQAADLVDQPGVEEVDHAAIDAVVQARAGKSSAKTRHVWRRGPVVLGLERR